MSGTGVPLNSFLCGIGSGRRACRPANGKELDQHETSYEAPNVRGIRYPTLLRSSTKHAKTADQLEHEPHANRYVSRYLREHAEKEDCHPAMGMKQYVATQHARDST